VAKASPNTETSTVPDDATPISPAPKSTAESGDVEPKIVVSEAAPTRPEASPEGVLVDRRAGAPAVTVLLVMTPGNYGIRRGNKTADPVLCTDEGCYIGGGPDKPARLLPIWQALGFGNTWGKRAGACNHALGCVFRGIQLGQWPARVQPVDLHILKHDRRRPSEVSSDSGCRSEAGRLACANGVYAESYAMWIVPESVAEAAGPAALQRALTEGLSGPRSAEVSRLSR
jgi:colicin import membrane protein